MKGHLFTSASLLGTTFNIMVTEKFFSTGPIENLVKQVSGLQSFEDKNQDLFNTLTEREVEILSLIAEGLKNPGIAARLGISRATVQNHRAKVRDKLNLTSQTDYIKFALAYNLIPF